MFYNESGERLEEVAQRSCGCAIIGRVQGELGRGFEQRDLVKDVPVHGRGVDSMIFKGLFQPNPLYDSMKDSTWLGTFPLSAPQVWRRKRRKFCESETKH